jgi:cbb3-type cytochrome oxidase subunit 3
MIHDLVTSLGGTMWPRISLILFLLLFAGIVWWTYRGGRQRYDDISRLPLDEKDISRSATETQGSRS